MKDYPYLTFSVGGFLQQVAVCYLRDGYWFYVQGQVRPGKDSFEVDRQILSRYRPDGSKDVRYRRRQRGEANLQYIRFERDFLIMATHGEHAFFEREREAIRDARRCPVKFRGHAVSYKAGHSIVRIQEDAYADLKAYFLGIACKRPREVLVEEFATLPFELYKPVLKQLHSLCQAVNRHRFSAGLLPVPPSCIRARRTIYRPFESAEYILQEVA